MTPDVQKNVIDFRSFRRLTLRASSRAAAGAEGAFEAKAADHPFGPRAVAVGADAGDALARRGEFRFRLGSVDVCAVNSSDEVLPRPIDRWLMTGSGHIAERSDLERSTGANPQAAVGVYREGGAAPKLGKYGLEADRMTAGRLARREESPGSTGQGGR